MPASRMKASRFSALAGLLALSNARMDTVVQRLGAAFKTILAVVLVIYYINNSFMPKRIIIGFYG